MIQNITSTQPLHRIGKTQNSLSNNFVILESDSFVNINKTNCIDIKDLMSSKTYEIYNNKTIKSKKIKTYAEILDNPQFTSEIFKNKKVLKASLIGLSKCVSEQLLDKKTKFSDIEKLCLIKGVLDYNISLLNKEDTLKIPSFGKIWHFFTDIVTPKNKAEIIVNRWSLSAAATAASLANTGIGDKIALTYITKEMCKRVFKTYEMNGGYTAAVTGVAVGTVLGTHAAATVLTTWPAVGNAANATISYALHQLTGRACIEFCEANKNSVYMSDIDAVAKFGIQLKNGLNIIQNEKVRQFANIAIDKILDTVL